MENEEKKLEILRRFHDEAVNNGDAAGAIELAEQYKSSGNFTKAEFTLSNAIADGGGCPTSLLCPVW